MKLIEVVKWDGGPNVFAYRFPETELNTKSQLIVTESQEAVLLKEGQFYGPYGPGRHVLDTKNVPFLTHVVTGLFSGGVSPFTAEVWFVQKAIPLDLKWGTSTPLQIEDPLYHLMLPVRAFGQYGLQVVNAKKFLAKLTGRITYFTTDILTSYFRGIIVTQAKDCIASCLLDKGISVLKIGNMMAEISQVLEDKLSAMMDEYGLRTLSFTVNSITTDDNDPAVKQLKAALAKKAEMNIIGYTYQQERSFDTMEAAAGNPGGGTVMNAGIGLGLGMAAGVPMGNAMSSITQNLNTEPTRRCPKCGAEVRNQVKFCPECGQNMAPPAAAGSVKCPKCGASCSDKVKFCPECGAKMRQTCKQCGAELSGNIKFCPECGTKQE
ncbi:MAG: SPFH domain-containing protein [Lentisphaeria bacterium]|nr:SPFH domain-containing protein [Lentisphaeria bacterium]